MGILNVTPDSFSGDGLLADGRIGRPSDGGTVAAAVAPGAGDGRRRRRPARHRRRVDAAGPRRRSTPRRSWRASCRSSRAVRAALPDDADQRRHDEAGRRRGGARGRRRPDQRRLGRRAGRRASRGVAATHEVPIVLMHNRAEAALRRPRRRGRRGPAARRSIGRSRAGVALGRPDRRPGLRLREDGRAEPRAAPRPRARSGPWVARSCSARHASRPSARSSTCRPTSGSRRRSRRRRSGSPPASTSSGSTTSAPTSAPRA